MSSKSQRIALIVLMLGVIGYTVFNYLRGGLSSGYFAVLAVLMGWMLIGQLRALIREWKE